MWIEIAAVLLGLFILVVVTLPLVRRLGTLRRAAVKLQRLRAQAMALQPDTTRLQLTAVQVFSHETLQQALAVIMARLGDDRGKHAPPHHR